MAKIMSVPLTKSKLLTTRGKDEVYVAAAIVFDFQPEDPENIYTALAVLSGRGVPGVVLTRRLKKLPRSRCWFVGYSNEDAVDKAYKFNNTWEADLRVGFHDCRDYTNGLVEHLTGEKLVLEHLRRTGGDQS
ncbi:hypothetical protein PTKIN_Ptkin15bG0161400 [Pterospermum kingtungense]